MAKAIHFFRLILGFITLLASEFAVQAQCPVSDPTTSNECIFSSGQVTLNASGSTGYYQWYNDSNGDSTLGSGPNYTTPTLNTSQTFYVAATDTNTALRFDGSNDYVALNKSYTLAGEIPTLTVEAWVNTTVGGLGDPFGNWSIVDFDRSEYYNLFVNGSTGEVGFSTYASSGGIDDFYSGVTVNDGNWHHIAAVYDGTDKIIYVDGYEVARKVNPHSGVNLGMGSTRFGFIGDGSEANGYNGNRNNRYFQGEIDEVRIWNDVRTPVEIASFRDTCLNGTEPNLETYFNFDEYSGSVLTDVTGNGSGGDLINMNLSTCWVQGAAVRCDCESNLVPALVTLESNLEDTLLTCGQPSIVLDAGPSAASYLWNTGETTQTITVGQNGRYEVTTSGGTCDGNAYVFVDGFTHSETALLFDGANDYTAIENMFYEGSDYSEVTIETWLKTTDAGDQIIASFDRSEYWRVEINGSGAGNGRVGFDLATNSGIVDFGSATRVDDGEWHHVACVYDNGSVEIYIDGILDASTSFGSLFGTGPTRYGFLGTGSESPTFNGSTGPNSYFNGELDEFRIWNRALDLTEIRTNMAKHVSGKSTGLQVYYKFDDINGSTIYDHNTSSQNNSVMYNFGGAAEVTSAAPIGDRSQFVYTGSWGGLTPSINSCDGETFTVSNVSGTPAGIHLYYVNNFPNDVSGLSGSGTYDRYFGVHKIDDPAATYTATYNYTGNPYINGTNESTIELFRRPDNATFPWVNTFGNLNIVANTIEAVGQNTEFIIDYFSVLPVSLIDYQGSYNRENNLTTLQWRTASELNCDYFIIEKSTNGLDFEILDTVAGAGNTNQTSNYETFDHNPEVGINYYRLKQFDFDGTENDLGVVAINRTSGSKLIVYPNPVESGGAVYFNKEVDSDISVFVQLYSSHGKLIKSSNIELKKGSNQIQMNLNDSISPGIYTFILSGEGFKEEVKLTVY